MKISVLDAKTLGGDLDMSVLNQAGEVFIYDTTAPLQVAERIVDSDVLIVNKIKLNETNLKYAKNIKLICITATGYDNVDISYCKTKGIGVCNAEGYSTHSVCQTTLAMAMYLMTHLGEYRQYVHSGSYSESGVANYLSPRYHEFYGKTWGIIGLGNIGRSVARVAEAMGCNVICTKRTPDSEYKTTDIDTLLSESDIISVHVPLTDETRGMINKERISKMKKNSIFINVARGAVCDEKALCEAVKQGKIAAIGVDVYSEEPFPKDSPYTEITALPNVCLMPHMAWGAYEARQRCINEVSENIRAFFSGETRNRVDLKLKEK